MAHCTLTTENCSLRNLFPHTSLTNNLILYLSSIDTDRSHISEHKELSWQIRLLGHQSLVVCLYSISEEGANSHNMISNYAMVPIWATFLFHFPNQPIPRSERCYHPFNSFLCSDRFPSPVIDIQQDSVTANRLKI